MNTTQLEAHPTPKAIVYRFFAKALNEASSGVADELVSPDFVASDGKNRENLKGFIRQMHHAFPDVQFKIQDTIVEGSRVVVRWDMEGTHGGSFAGVAPTGRRITNQGISIYRVVDGQIVEGWSQVDRLGVLQQVGALPLLGESGPGTRGETQHRS
jgi:steroid delta-isomerase-like uncharacterized protein